MKNSIRQALCLCLPLLAMIASCNRNHLSGTRRETHTDSIQLLVTSISACSKLYTSQYELRKILVYNDTTTIDGHFLNHHIRFAMPLSDRRIAIPVSATAKACIDLSKIKPSDIKRQGEQIEIVLPDPEITLTATEIDHKGVKQKVGLLRHDFTDNEITAIQQQGRRSILSSLSHTGIIKDAQASATRLIVPAAEKLGFNESQITVTFRKDFTQQDYNSLIRQLN